MLKKLYLPQLSSSKMMLKSGLVLMVLWPQLAGAQEAVEARDGGTNLTTLAKLQEIISTHPGVSKAQQDFCEAGFSIMQEKTAYYPKLNMSLSGGDKMVDKTTRGDEFGGNSAPEHDGKGLNVSLTLNQQLYDWGRTSAAVNKASLNREAVNLQGIRAFDEKLFEFYKAALVYERESRVLDLYAASAKAIEKQIMAIEKRFESGAGRISEVRAAQIIGLDVETKTQSTENRQVIAERNLVNNYEVDGAFGRAAIRDFMARRDEAIDTVEVEQNLEWRIREADLRAAGYDYKRLNASRLPVISGVLVGQAWDVEDKKSCGDVLTRSHPDAAYYNGAYRRYSNCNTYELAGRVEMTMPLFDGGLNRAQRAQVKAQRRSIEADMSAIERTHRADSLRVQQVLRDTLMKLASQQRKIVEIKQQLESERRVQGQTRVDPLMLASLAFDLARAEEELIGLETDAEFSRLEALRISNRLGEVLGLTWERSGC